MNHSLTEKLQRYGVEARWAGEKETALAANFVLLDCSKQHTEHQGTDTQQICALHPGQVLQWNHSTTSYGTELLVISDPFALIGMGPAAGDQEQLLLGHQKQLQWETTVWRQILNTMLSKRTVPGCCGITLVTNLYSQKEIIVATQTFWEIWCQILSTGHGL